MPGGGTRFPRPNPLAPNPRVPSGIVGCLGAADSGEAAAAADFAAVVVVDGWSPSPPAPAAAVAPAAASPSPPTIASGPSRNVLFSLNAAAEAHCE